MSVGVPTKREPYLHPVNVAGPLAGVYQELRQSPRNEIPSITRTWGIEFLGPFTFFLVFPAEFTRDSTSILDKCSTLDIDHTV